MNVLIWNCRGAAKAKLKGIMKTLVRSHKVEVVVLLKPRVSGIRAQKVIQNLGYVNYIIEDAVVELVDKTSQAILVRLSKPNNSPFIFSVVYANPRVERKKKLWEVLRSWHQMYSEPWLVAGDFNEILSAEEKKGRAPVDFGRCSDFADVLDDCNLMDLGNSGPFFT
ncbi:uncharacterized protein LOC133293642 [Gastrolobium bilobum]|uniref:uncharacterized protein LOC133293642 n=1 Tax=Gastrolobium bilobum TaxID=150636 RepID=UPI002AB1AF68|nr:uncharacterized protein LOC133293642 [Gastrolobium bilobum]